MPVAHVAKSYWPGQSPDKVGETTERERSASAQKLSASMIAELLGVESFALLSIGSVCGCAPTRYLTGMLI